MSRRLLPAAFIAACVLLASGAPVQATEGSLQVLVDHPCVLSYSVHNEHDYHAQAGGPVLQTVFTVNRENRYDILADGPADFLHRWHASKEDVVAGSLPISLVTTRELNIGRTAGLLAVLGLAIGGGIYRRTHAQLQTSQREKQVMAEDLTRAQSRAGLFPLDGALPDRVGPYRVVGRLGSGGMAVVYQVESPAGDLLALKLPLPHVWDDPEFKKRFGRELKIASSLRHPNLVHIVDLNDGVGGEFSYPYLVMEWVRGQTLSSHLGPDTAHPLQNVVTIGLQALAALGHAHQNNIVHRDIKPSNLMVTDDGQLRVMDFGVARTTDGTRLTGTEETLGTPLYMAPEQVDSGPVDGRTDIYALGIVLYEMLAGEPPFHDGNYLALTLAKLRQDAAPVSMKCPGVDPRLEKCIMKMIARRPEDRHWTTEEAAADLRSLGVTPTRFIPVEPGTGASETPTQAVPYPPPS